MEIRRIKIRSVLRLVFLFHVLIGLFVGFLLVAAWGTINIFGMNELIPAFLGNVGEPTVSALLVLFSVSALTIGILGALVWSLLALLYNVIAGFAKGIEIETAEDGTEGRGNEIAE